MNIKYKDMTMIDASDDFFLLCNSKKLNVYNTNGTLIEEFKVSLLSNALLFDDKIFVLQMHKKSILYINIYTGLKKRISFKKDIDKIQGIYKKNDKELIIVAFKIIKDENNELANQSHIILYNVEENSYQLILGKREEYLFDNVLIYKGQAYFVALPENHWKNKYHKIYILNESCLEECSEGCLEYKIEKFSISRDGKFFQMIDTKKTGVKKI